MAKKTNKFTNGDADATHIDTGTDHIIKLENIKVLIVPDGPFWYAQGIEIDCAAQGATIEEAKKNFEKMLDRAILRAVATHRTIEPLLHPVPSEIFQHVTMGVTEENMQWQRFSQHLGMNLGMKERRSDRPAEVNIKYLVAKQGSSF